MLDRDPNIGHLRLDAWRTREGPNPVIPLRVFFNGRLALLAMAVLIAFHSPASSRQNKGKIIIQVHGESTAAGWPLPEIGFAKQLEYYLKHVPMEVRPGFENRAEGGIPSSEVLRRIRGSIKDEPDLLIVFSGHNDLISPTSDVLDYGMWRAGVFLRSLAGRSVETAEGREARELALLPSDQRKAIVSYRANIKRIVKTAKKRGVPLILCTVPYNMLWPPVYKGGLGPRYESLVTETIGLMKEGRYDPAEVALENALREDSADPILNYLLGRIFQARGRHDKAIVHYRKAKESDRMRIRVLSVCNTIIRNAAREEGVYLADVENAFIAQSDHGVMSYGLFADNCHPSPEGHFLIARTVYDVIVRQGFIRFSSPRSLGERDFAMFLDESGFSRKGSALRESYFFWSGLYHLEREDRRLDYTDFKIDTARDYFNKALTVNARNWETWINLSAISFLKGERARGESEFRRARELSGGAISKSNPTVRHIIRALARSGLSFEDISSDR